MNLESAKIMKVVDELGTHFLHAHHAASLHASVEKKKDG